MTTARKGAHLTPQQWMRARGLFESALDLPEKERAGWILLQCADDDAVRAEAEQLLSTVTSDSILDTPIGVLSTIHPDDIPTSLAGRRLGPWKVIEAIGRGGMGEVWLAERADGAYEQRVAIKLLKRGLDTDLILDRFLRERRILARLSHPHIARLIDAGASEDGRPYLVMEHIDGLPITQWCKNHELDLRARLVLFEQICEAVHAAHRQQIVHRDLKPSNVLVACDGEVKLLDFGIAKLVGENDATQTSFGSTPATLHYGAPEQLLGDPVTTASDVYSLGVILYELLTGHLPHRHTSLALALHAAAQDELSATRPSVALRQGGRRDIVAEARARQIEGEVDWIALKALQRDPARRYRTAAEMADDVRRFLDHRPVLARPDSFLYRANRFIRRHRVGVAAVTITLLSLLTGLTVSLWQAQRAEHEANRAEQVKQLLVSIFEQSNPLTSQRKDIPVRELLDRGAAEITGKLGGDPLTQAELYEALAQIELGVMDDAKALQFADLSLQLRREHLRPGDPLIADVLAVHGHALQQSALFARIEGEPDQILQRAANELQEADRIYAQAPGDHRLKRAEALKSLAIVVSNLGKEAQALQFHEQALQLLNQAVGPDAIETLNEKASAADELALNGRRAESVQWLREAIAGLKVRRGPLHTDVALAEDRLARVLYETAQYEESEQAMTVAIDIYSRVQGNDNEMAAAERVQRGLTRSVLNRFADADADFAAARPMLQPGSYPDAQLHDFHSTRYSLQERYAEAAQEMQLAVNDYRKITSSGDSEVWSAQSDGALYLGLSGDAIRAEQLIRESLAKVIENGTEKSGEVGDSRFNLGIVLSLLGRVTEAEAQLRQSIQLHQAFVSKDEDAILADMQHWIAWDLLSGRHDAARLTEARNLAQLALGVQKTSHQPQTVVSALSLAAWADRESGDSDQATAELREAIGIQRDELPGIDTLFGAGTAVPSQHRYELARNLADLGDPAAGPLFDEAVAGFQHSAPGHYLFGNVLLDRAKWRLAHGDPNGARKDQTAAIVAFQKNQGVDSIYLAQARALMPSTAGGRI